MHGCTFGKFRFNNILLSHCVSIVYITTGLVIEYKQVRNVFQSTCVSYKAVRGTSSALKFMMKKTYSE